MNDICQVGGGAKFSTIECHQSDSSESADITFKIVKFSSSLRLSWMSTQSRLLQVNNMPKIHKFTYNLMGRLLLKQLVWRQGLFNPLQSFTRVLKCQVPTG